MLAWMSLRLVFAALLVLTACDAEPETAPPATPSPTPVPTASPSPVPGPTPTPSPACTDATVTGAVEVRISARDFSFDPSCLIVLGGQGLVVRNTGANLHNLTVEDSSVRFDVPPGGVARTAAIGSAVPPGTYAFYCIYHRGQGMTGELTVSEAG
jgi:plastocyanin